MCDESHHVVAYIVCEGFADARVEFDLIPADHIPHNEPEEEPAVVVEDVTDDHGMEM